MICAYQGHYADKHIFIRFYHSGIIPRNVYSMLTISDALQLDIFKGAQVVAGRAGLNRIIIWVHNVGVPDAARWLHGGELALTTGINMPSDPAEQQTYLHDLIDKEVAGLCIAVGRFIDRIPDYLRETADAHGFPLIEIPYQTPFVDVTRTINQMISRRDVVKALEIQHALTQLVLEGGGMVDLATTLARLVNQSVSIENERFEAFASVNIAAVDEARRYTQRHGRTDPRLVKALEQRGYLPDIRRTLRPVNLPKMPDVGLEMERILAPIVIHGEIIGFMWIIGDGRPLADLEHMAIESGATIAALLLLRQEAVQREEASQRGDLIASLMQSDGATNGREELFTDRVLRYGVDLRQPYRVLLADSGAGNGKRSSASRASLFDRIVRLAEANKWPVMVGQFAGQLLILAQESPQLSEITSQIAHALNGDGGGGGGAPRIGVSGIGVGIGDRRVAGCYAECQEVLHIARRLKQPEKVVYFDHLGYLHALYRAGRGALDGSPYLDGLNALVDEQGADLFHTLEVYLDLGGNGVGAAEALHVHRSTLNYRLARIGEICGVDLSDPVTRTNLQMALKLMRLFAVD